MSNFKKLNTMGLRVASVSAIAMLSVSFGGTAAYANECLLDTSSTSVGLADPGDGILGASGSAISSLACGRNSVANGAATTALGESAQATNVSATAVGFNANASGAGAVALGSQAIATQNRSTALGRGAQALNFSSTAIGTDAVTTADNQIVVGAVTGNATQEIVLNGGAAVTIDGAETINNSTTTTINATMAATIDTMTATIDSETTTINATTSATINAPTTTINGATTTINATTAATIDTATATIDATTATTINSPTTTINATTATINAPTVTINDTSTTIASLATVPGGVVVADPSGRLGVDTVLPLTVAMNTAAIAELREGVAAIAAIPDLYLNVDETWTIAGGVSLYSDDFGGTETGFGGGFQWRSSTDDNWSIGLAGSIAGDTYSGRLQARFGG